MELDMEDKINAEGLKAKREAARIMGQILYEVTKDTRLKLINVLNDFDDKIKDDVLKNNESRDYDLEPVINLIEQAVDMYDDITKEEK